VFAQRGEKGGKSFSLLVMTLCRKKELRKISCLAAEPIKKKRGDLPIKHSSPVPFGDPDSRKRNHRKLVNCSASVITHLPGSDKGQDPAKGKEGKI